MADVVFWEIPTEHGVVRRAIEVPEDDDELKNPEAGPPAGFRLDLSMLPLRLDMLPEILLNNIAHSAISVLNLNDCGLVSIPQPICRMVNLVRLRLHSNSLETLPEAIGNLRHLERLNVYGNRLMSLPRSLCKLSSLKILRLGGNKLRNDSLEITSQLVCLKELYLRQNFDLTAIPQAVCSMESLEVLNADACDELEYPPLAVISCGMDTVRWFASHHMW